MRNPVPLLAILLILWLFGGCYLWTSTCCLAGAATSSIAPLLIKDGSTTVAQHSNNFFFGFSGSTPNMTTPVSDELTDAANYLKANPGKTMTLTGQYDDDEKKPGNFANLGLARAESIKQQLIKKGAPAAQLATAALLVKDLKFSDDKLYGGINYAFSEAPTSGISIKDGSAFSAGSKDNLRFDKSGYVHKTPLAASVNDAFGKTAEYLKKNAGRSLLLTGFYSDAEKNNSPFPSLGLARANNIKQIFTNLGVPSKQLLTADSKVANLQFPGDELNGGVSYSISAATDNSNRLAEVEKRLRAKPLLIYFATGKQEVNLNSEQRQYFSDLTYYLDQKPNAKISSTGHTDNQGDRNQNVRLGRKRAEFVRDYLAKNGISSKQVNVSSKGPDEPIETNDTDAGRAKNRRVAITLN